MKLEFCKSTSQCRLTLSCYVPVRSSYRVGNFSNIKEKGEGGYRGIHVGGLTSPDLGGDWLSMDINDFLLPTGESTLSARRNVAIRLSRCSVN